MSGLAIFALVAVHLLGGFALAVYLDGRGQRWALPGFFSAFVLAGATAVTIGMRRAGDPVELTFLGVGAAFAAFIFLGFYHAPVAVLLLALGCNLMVLRMALADPCWQAWLTVAVNAFVLAWVARWAWRYVRAPKEKREEVAREGGGASTDLPGSFP